MHYGPIDLIVGIEGSGRKDAEMAAFERFRTVLDELVAELPALRLPTRFDTDFKGRMAKSMHMATLPFLPEFITPMAAVAGAVADEMIRSIALAGRVTRAWVNNGGDAAFLLREGEKLRVSIAAPSAAHIEVRASDNARGIATSGWKGRSHSFGIADAVTVAACSAAEADAAATMIANRVELDEHPEIRREPASDLSPDTDLGEMPVTTGVGKLSDVEIRSALDNGQSYAQNLCDAGVIECAALFLRKQSRIVGKGGFISLKE